MAEIKKLLIGSVLKHQARFPSASSLSLGGPAPGREAPSALAGAPHTRGPGREPLLTVLSLQNTIVFWVKDWECLQGIIKGNCSLTPLNFFKLTAGKGLRVFP